ncbi:MAG: hypothetical protein RBT80_19685 [Candidatus Vecturithrix sp.]|nr:hypothetical protein [Candidatus Vecturithrix sp.]
MKADKELIIRYFLSKKMNAKHFPKRKVGKKPDFELYLEKTLFGFCEIKSIVDYEFSGLRHDPTYNKIQNKIHEAADQLKAANPEHTVPNIVFFINHTDKVGWADLWYVLTGQLMPHDWPSKLVDLTYLKRLVEKDDLIVVDYIIWADTFRPFISYVINQDSAFAGALRNNIGSAMYENTDINSI